ncbi:MAG: hypothetical protein SVX43_10810, partial [Cyanobacteriota bacterium]|nr:hypothetical protein [Cyanobacteriota bacterium]
MTQTYLAKMGGGSGITSIASAGYTPLEQNNGKAVPQSDFYALGRTFVYLLTGKHPTEFDDDPDRGTLIWHADVLEGFSPLLELLDEMMAPFPAQRPKNTQEIFRRLAEIEQKYALFRSDPVEFAKVRDRVPGEIEVETAIQPNSSSSFPQDRIQGKALDRPRSSISPLVYGLGGGLVSLAIAGGAIGYVASLPPRPTVSNPLQSLTLALPPRSELPLPEAPPPEPSPSPTPEPTPEPTPLVFKDEDKGVAIEVVESRWDNNPTQKSVIVKLELVNQQAEPLPLLFSSLEWIDDLGQMVSATPEQWPDEIPPKGKAAGVLRIPEGSFSSDAQYFSLNVDDVEHNFKLEISEIPLPEPQ